MHARQFLDILQRIAQGDAELGATGLGLLQRFGYGAIQQQISIPAMTTEGRTTVGAMCCFIRLNVFKRRLLRRMTVRQLLGQQHRPDREYGALDILSTDAEKIAVGDAMGLVELALVATLDQG